MSSEIFEKKHSFYRFVSLSSKYPSENLYQALQKVFSSKGIDPQTPQTNRHSYPTVTLDDKKLKRWRTEILTNASNTFLIDAMMESTAAPTFFPSYKDHIDGGIAADDPSAVGLCGKWWSQCSPLFWNRIYGIRHLQRRRLGSAELGLRLKSRQQSY